MNSKHWKADPYYFIKQSTCQAITRDKTEHFVR